MKTDKLTDAIGMVDEKLIARADKKNTKVKRIVKWTVPIAAMLAVTMTLGVFFWNMPSAFVLNAYALTEVEYPTLEHYPYTEQDHTQYNIWSAERAERNKLYGNKGDNLDTFFQKAVTEFLTSDPNENAVFSPLNIYMALSLLAEVTTGDSQKEILTLLNANSIEELRTQANCIWNANYRNDGSITNIMANSVWMNENIEYEPQTLETLAKNYYAQAFQGKMGSRGYDNALKEWLKKQTGGMLDGEIDSLSMTPETVLTLASTLYLKAAWSNDFNKSLNTTEFFNSASGSVLTDYMHKSEETYLYTGENFTAIILGFKTGGSMTFALPNETVSTAELKSDPEFLSFLTAKEWENKEKYLVNMSIPKFDIKQNGSIAEGLKNLGVRSCFEFSNDFSPMVTNDIPVKVSDIEHGARVKIDEKGVEAAAFTTIMMITGTASKPPKTIDFVLDRPFIFWINNTDSLPLFVGTVNTPEPSSNSEVSLSVPKVELEELEGRWLVNGKDDLVIDINKSGDFSLIDNTLGKTFDGNTCSVYPTAFKFVGEKLNLAGLRVHCQEIAMFRAPGHVLVIDESKKVLFDTYSYNYFIREDAVNSAEGRMLKGKFDVMRTNLSGKTDLLYVSYAFDYTGSIIRTAGASFDQKTTVVGSWEYTSGGAVLKFNDGSTVTLKDTDTTLTIDGTTYTKTVLKDALY